MKALNPKELPSHSEAEIHAKLEKMLVKIKATQWALADIDWDAPGREIATPICQPASAAVRKRPNGRFWIGKSQSGRLADSTQLCSAGSCVASITGLIA